MPENGGTFKGEFIGSVNMQLQFLKDALRDQKSDMKAISETLQELRDFRSRILAYAGMAAAAATFGVHLLTTHLGG